MQIGKYRLLETCGACPEAYNVFIDHEDVGERYVAHLRLRHGVFTVDTPINGNDFGDEKTIYTAYPNGDGIFQSDERDKFLGEAIFALDRHLNTVEEVCATDLSYAALELRKLRAWLRSRPDYTLPDGDISDAEDIIAYVEKRI